MGGRVVEGTGLEKRKPVSVQHGPVTFYILLSFVLTALVRKSHKAFIISGGILGGNWTQSRFHDDRIGDGRQGQRKYFRQADAVCLCHRLHGGNHEELLEVSIGMGENV